MKQLLLTLLVFCSCKGPSAQIEQTKSKNQNIEILPIDKNKLSKADKDFIDYADALSNAIDSNSEEVKSLDTASVYKDLPSSLICHVFTRPGSNNITKITASVENAQQSLTYSYYYSNGEVVKSINELRDHEPFKAICYFYGARTIVPKGISLKTGEAARDQSKFLLNYFKQ